MEPGVNIDDRHFRALQFPDVSPNIVVVRSDLKFFVKVSDNFMHVLVVTFAYV